MGISAAQVTDVLKLLADGKMHVATQELEKDESLYYLIVAIIRGVEEEYGYWRDKDISIYKGDSLLAKVAIKDVAEYAQSLYHSISGKKQGKGGINIDGVEELFEKLHLQSLSDAQGNTTDIKLVIYDPVLQSKPRLGFSIKSYIGNKPTLFNANKSSNFIYRIAPDLSEEQVLEINQMGGYTERINWLVENGYSLIYCKVNNPVFQRNLELIDSRLPEIWSHLLIKRFASKARTVQELTEYLDNEDPCKFDLGSTQGFYTYKIKRLLVDAALGMKAATPWKGLFDATGGYIAVRKDGELLCYHIYNWNDFQEYLFKHTKIDLPSSSRHGYGIVEEASEVGENSGYYIKLNFQIRFR